MPFTGGFCPGPLVTGGGNGGSTSNVTLLQRVWESLMSARGSMYSQSLTSAVGIEMMAYARAIVYDGIGQNQRLANANYPYTLTEEGNLTDWETIFGLTPSPTDTLYARQTRLAVKWGMFSGGNGIQDIADVCNAMLGSVAGVPRFEGVLLQNPNTVGATGAYWPNGRGISSNTSLPWYSLISSIGILCTFNTSLPVNQQVADFISATSSASQILSELLPAHVTYTFGTYSSAGTAVFLLDDVHNLDFEFLS